MAKTPIDRQPGRSTFAFAPAAPPQAGATSSGAFSGVRVSGGNSGGGAERATPMTFVDPADDHVPEFIRGAMEPYIRAKQQEKFVKGFTDSVAGKTIKEVQEGDSGLASIFGPSTYHKGAAFEAAGSYDDLTANLATNPDLTKNLSTEETGKFLAEQYRGLFTGDTAADAMLQQKIMAGHGALVSTLTKFQYAEQQTQTARAHGGMIDSAATVLQSIGTAQASVGAPDAASQASLTQSTSNLFGALQRPEGMADETYRKSIGDSLRLMLDKGNLYAYNALKAKGALGLLDTDEQAKLEARYDTAAHKTMSEVAAFDPTYISMLAGVHADTASGRLTTPMEASKRIAAANTYIMSKTGSDVPLLDAGAVVSAANSVTDAAVLPIGAGRIGSGSWRTGRRHGSTSATRSSARLSRQRHKPAP